MHWFMWLLLYIASVMIVLAFFKGAREIEEPPGWEEVFGNDEESEHEIC